MSDTVHVVLGLTIGGTAMLWTRTPSGYVGRLAESAQSAVRAASPYAILPGDWS